MTARREFRGCAHVRSLVTRWVNFYRHGEETRPTPLARVAILVTSNMSGDWYGVMVVTWNGTGTICGMIGVPSLASGVRS